jgi:hypothetical protein
MSVEPFPRLPESPPAGPGRLIPADLPQVCPDCGKPFSLFSNYSTRTSLLGRRFHALAILGGPLGLGVVLVINGLILGGVGIGIGDRSLPYGMILGLLAPVILFEGLALICKKVRTLRCHACGWEQDFPWPKKP